MSRPGRAGVARRQKAGAEDGVHGGKRVDAIALPAFRGGHAGVAQRAQPVTGRAVGRKLARVGECAAAENRVAGFGPCAEHGEVRRIVHQRLVHENRQPRLDKRPAARHMLVALVRGDDYRVHRADDVLGPRGHVRDARSRGHFRRIRRVVGPHVRDAHARHAQRGFGLIAEVFGDGRKRAFRHFRAVETVEDCAPRIRVPVAVHHAQHRQRERAIAQSRKSRNLSLRFVAHRVCHFRAYPKQRFSSVGWASSPSS